MQTALICDPFFTLHDTGDHPESPDRIAAIARGLAAAGLTPRLLRLPPRTALVAELRLVHAPDYLKTIREDLAAGAAVLSTGDTALSPRSLDVARRAAGSVLNAIDAVVSGNARHAFCAVRPPGHHASPSRGMGFCILNHIALAARYAQKKHGIEKILIVDWDVHHGNGTQEVFYSDDSVLFFSAHQHPWFPGTGRRHETGRGRGLGCTVNAPLPAGSGLREMLGECDRFDRVLARFKPDLILISAGFDSRIDDPLGRFMLSDEDFAALTRRVKQWAADYAGGRLISVLEGGYNLETLGAAAAAHVAALVEE